MRLEREETAIFEAYVESIGLREELIRLGGVAAGLSAVAYRAMNGDLPVTSVMALAAETVAQAEALAWSTANYEKFEEKRQGSVVRMFEIAARKGEAHGEGGSSDGSAAEEA